MFKKILFLLLLLYAVVGFFVLPWLAKSQIIKLVAQETNAKVHIESIYFNPFLFKLKFHNLQLTDKANTPLIQFKTFSLNLELYSLFAKTVHIKNILLDKPELFLALSQEKKLNLLGILKETQAQKNPSKPLHLPRIIIDKIKLLDGNVAYQDNTKKEKFAFDFHNIYFVLENLDTNNMDSNATHLNFYTGLGDGGNFQMQTELKSITPLVLDGHLSLQANKLYTPWKYIKDMLNFEVADGKVSFNAHFHFNADDINATLADKIGLKIDKLRIIPKNGHQDIVTLHNFTLQNASVKPFAQDVQIDKITLDTLHLDAKRNAKEQIDLLHYLKLNKKETKKTSIAQTAPRQKPWSVLLKDLELKNISANFEDNGISPNVTTKLDTLNISAKDITLAGEKPFDYTVFLRLNDSLECQAQGLIQQKVLDVHTHLQCKNFNLVHYRPYLDSMAKDALKVYNVKLRSATLSLDTTLDLTKEKKKILLQVSDTNVSVQKLRISKRWSRKTLLSLHALNVSKLSFDLSHKKLTIGKVAFVSPQINALLNKKGVLNLENLIVPKKSKPQLKTKKKEKAFEASIKHFAIYNAKVRFRDRTLSPSTLNTVDKINLHLYHIDSKRRTWLSYKLSSRINFKGKLRAKGKLRHTPLKEKGSLQLSHLGLTNLTPYVQKKAFIKVADGKLFVNASTEYDASKTKADLQVQGSIGLEDFFLNDSRTDASVFSINDVNVSKFTFEYNPNRLYVDQVTLKSFYIDALVDKQKKMNFAKLLKKSDVNTSQDTNTTQFPIKIAKVNIVEGNAKFADLSIPIQFKTDIHGLVGTIYAISNDANETTFVDIDGEVDAYGSTKLKGSIKSANPKEFTDLHFNFKNLALHSLSGYSAKFAGYQIEKGKLFLDLGYKIQNSQLLGKNNIMIKHIQLGKENSDENVTKLPLGFVIGLLENSDGIIDIDMPVQGDLDNPDFKYGALVWKTFSNLIVRAVSSPFRFLGSLMGLDSDALEYVEFEGGSAKISPTQREKLDNIVKMMRKKPKLVLDITPLYDEQIDKKALKKQKLIHLVMKKSGISNEKEHQNAMNVDMLESIYSEAKKDVDLSALHEQYKEKYFNELLKRCIKIQTVSDKELKALAQTRASTIQKYLIEEKSIKKSRVVIQKMKKEANSSNNFVRIGLHVDVK